MNSRGQIQVTFNWVFILIAGAVILLFFIGIVVKQKDVSEQRLNEDVVSVMESIFTGAGVSEKTKNSISTSGLADYTFYFSCEEGVSEYGIKDRPARTQDNIMPLFSPKELKTTNMLTLSLPYKMPYKSADLLFVTSDNTKYYLTGSGNGFWEEFMNSTEGFNIEYVPSINLPEIDAGKNFQVRIIDLDGDKILDGGEVPENLLVFEDDKITAVSFITSEMVDYFEKDGNVWRKTNQNHVQIISLDGERDAAKYAAIFSGDETIYMCNMKKAFQRLEYVTRVYGGPSIVRGDVLGKLYNILEYYEITHPEYELSRPECIGNLKKFPQNMIDALTIHQNRIVACLIDQNKCTDIITSAKEVQDINENLELNCVPLY
jgi:hypothetical protein